MNRIKLVLLVTLLTLISCQFAFGQVELGITSGLNVSNVQVSGVAQDFTPDRKFIKTFRPALTVAIPLDDRFSILTGIATEARGFDVFVGREIKFLGLDIPLGATLETRVNYLEVPINFKLDFPTASSKFRPWIAAGANVGYAYAGDITTKVNVIFDFTVNRTNLNLNSNAVRRFDLAPTLIAGIDIPYKRTLFTFSLGYEHSVQNFLNDTALGIETRHFGFTPNFGLSYALGKISKA